MRTDSKHVNRTVGTSSTSAPTAKHDAPLEKQSALSTPLNSVAETDSFGTSEVSATSGVTDLQELLLDARSRRVASGREISGPLAFQSAQAPKPLTLEEEAKMAWAAAGITGPVVGDLPYQQDLAHMEGGGNVMMNLGGRTVASPDAAHTNILFVVNDDGVWMLKRPRDFNPEEFQAVVEAGRQGRFVDAYKMMRVKVSDSRPLIPNDLPETPVFNKGAINLPGTTYFVPVMDNSAMYISLCFSFLTEESGFMIIDEETGAPAGLADHGQSKGGHLNDNPFAGNTFGISVVDSVLERVANVEQGGMHQNLRLMGQQLGLGGFPHWAGHPSEWGDAFGFKMAYPRSSTGAAGLSSAVSAAIKGTPLDFPVPTPVGLERDGERLLTPFAPPYYGSVREAVLAFVDAKFNEKTGTLTGSQAPSSWKEADKVKGQMARYSEQHIEAVVKFCEYVEKKFGRFPPKGPYSTSIAYQAHHLDTEFYDDLYQAETLPSAQRLHQDHAPRADELRAKDDRLFAAHPAQGNVTLKSGAVVPSTLHGYDVNWTRFVGRATNVEVLEQILAQAGLKPVTVEKNGKREGIVSLSIQDTVDSNFGPSQELVVSVKAGLAGASIPWLNELSGLTADMDPTGATFDVILKLSSTSRDVNDFKSEHLGINSVQDPASITLDREANGKEHIVVRDAQGRLVVEIGAQEAVTGPARIPSQLESFDKLSKLLGDEGATAVANIDAYPTLTVGSQGAILNHLKARPRLQIVNDSNTQVTIGETSEVGDVLALLGFEPDFASRATHAKSVLEKAPQAPPPS